MLKHLEAKYTLFDSVEAMLSPQSLSDLLSKPITRIELRPMNGHSGVAGGQLSYVDASAERLVLKRMSMSLIGLCLPVMTISVGLSVFMHSFTNILMIYKESSLIKGL